MYLVTSQINMYRKCSFESPKETYRQATLTRSRTGAILAGLSDLAPHDIVFQNTFESDPKSRQEV